MISPDTIPARQPVEIRDTVVHVAHDTVKHVEQPADRHVTPATASQPGSASAGHTVAPVTTPSAAVHVLRNDSVGSASDTLASDTVRVQHEFGVVLTPPPHPTVEEREDTSSGMSFIYGGLLLLFCIIGIRFHNSRKYVASMLRNLVEIRMRNNVFDETVRETSFLVLLNLMWSCSAGVMLYGLLRLTVPDNPIWSVGIPALVSKPAASVALCMGVGVVYTCFMAIAYYVVGSVFSDGKHAGLWLKGYTAGQGLLSFIYFPLALLMLCWPEWGEILLWIALGTFVLSKIVFIWKGFRIFFTQISSWLLFLYYLCSLEIVPLILTYLAAMWLCSLLH